MPNVKIVVGEEILFQGQTGLLPSVGDLVAVGDQTHQVESVSWALEDDTLGPVTIKVSDQPYSY